METCTSFFVHILTAKPALWHFATASFMPSRGEPLILVIPMSVNFMQALRMAPKSWTLLIEYSAIRKKNIRHCVHCVCHVPYCEVAMIRSPNNRLFVGFGWCRK